MRKAEGAKKKAEREQAKKTRLTLAGKDITKLNKKETDALLLAICLSLGITDTAGVIK